MRRFLAIIGVLWIIPALSLASSWNPTLLVNTEAFQVIDEGDGTTDVTIQFGDILSESITYERGASQFNFSDDIFVSGNVTTTGTFSGNTLTLSGLANCDQIVTNSDGDFGCGTVVSLTGANLATLQVRRDTDYLPLVANTFFDIVFNNTDTQSDATVLEHNTTSTERVDIKQDGFYLISYHVNANSTTTTSEMQARVRVNNTTTLTGSLTIGRNYQNEYSPNVSTNVAYLQNGDYITLQVSRDAVANNTIINETVLTATKLNGIKGEKGDKGDAGDLTYTSAEGIFVNQGGDTMTGSLVINGGTLNVTGDVATNSNFAINNDNGATDAILTFGNDILAETLRFSDTSNAFEFSDDLLVSGDLQVTGNINSLCGPHESYTFERGNIASNQSWSLGNGQTPWGAPMFCDGTVTAIAATCTNATGTSLDAVVRINDVATGCSVNLSTTQGQVTSSTCSQSFSSGDVVGVYAGTESGAWSECVATIWLKYD